MGMAAIKAEFVKGLGAGGSLISGTMENIDGGKEQRLTFKVHLANGDTRTVTENIPAMHSLEAAALRMGQECSDSKGE